MTRFMPETGPEDVLLSSYRFALPEELIAQEPSRRRDASRLMVLDRAANTLTDAVFADLAAYLTPGVIVVNNSRVVPARVLGSRPSGGRVEFLLTTPLPHIVPEAVPHTAGEDLWQATVSCLLKSSKKVPVNETITLGKSFSATVLERGEYGQCLAKLIWRGSLPDRLLSEGVMPLPPYIKRPQSADDAERYQTVYAQPEKAGSIAAPTAGLHFTPAVKQALIDAGFTWAEVTLYVGYGTFSPVRCDDIRDHQMHKEYCEVPEETAKIIAEARRQGRPITAVGTTAARTLEGVARQHGSVVPFKGWTDIFLYPGKTMKVVDHLLTNFHLPESTLLMLISAFAGRERVLEAYAKAVAERYRFFSYGDAMLIL
ncbi:S-adenosylmethionine:tRNA ribosyltransferase-isomerase [uncultured delta proteobacterium]|uniref:S-adenosylmethionine:tRNA ribosyltransferase-isomerase n=1 Tax=uncultured delta proteobacterium TaxID=34034 RepID=A0A212JZ54_9DELT|nr:S-adenosylmethionine:tRNA ribosyltransferase-isomerase [uncultured delta proteobacterium]